MSNPRGVPEVLRADRMMRRGDSRSFTGTRTRCLTCVLQLSGWRSEASQSLHASCDCHRLLRRNRKVERLADYGMKDGKIFDYVTQTTPSGGEELSYLSYMFRIFKWS